MRRGGFSIPQPGFSPTHNAYRTIPVKYCTRIGFLTFLYVPLTEKKNLRVVIPSRRGGGFFSAQEFFACIVEIAGGFFLPSLSPGVGIFFSSVVGSPDVTGEGVKVT